MNRQRGYTLIEVIVAFALLALAMTLLLGTLSGAARQVRWSADAGRATLHAQSLLDQTGVGEALQPGRRDGEFEDGRYRWSLEIVPYVDAGGGLEGVPSDRGKSFEGITGSHATPPQPARPSGAARGRSSGRRPMACKRPSSPPAFAGEGAEPVASL